MFPELDTVTVRDVLDKHGGSWRARWRAAGDQPREAGHGRRRPAVAAARTAERRRHRRVGRSRRPIRRKRRRLRRLGRTSAVASDGRVRARLLQVRAPATQKTRDARDARAAHSRPRRPSRRPRRERAVARTSARGRDTPARIPARGRGAGSRGFRPPGRRSACARANFLVFPTADPLAGRDAFFDRSVARPRPLPLPLSLTPVAHLPPLHLRFAAAATNPAGTTSSQPPREEGGASGAGSRARTTTLPSGAAEPERRVRQRRGGLRHLGRDRRRRHGLAREQRDFYAGELGRSVKSVTDALAEELLGPSGGGGGRRLRGGPPCAAARWSRAGRR